MPTVQINGASVNDDDALEHEADLFGERAAGMKADRLQEILPRPMGQSGDTLQCFEKDGVVYHTVGEYCRAYANENPARLKRKEYLDPYSSAFSKEFIGAIDISQCTSWKQIKEVVEQTVRQEVPVRPDIWRYIFDRHKMDMWNHMDLSNQYNRSAAFGADCEMVEKYMHNLSIFNLLYEHEQLDRPEEYPMPGEVINPSDIQPGFEKEKSCVITALFQAESGRIAGEFGARNVEEFHNVLVGAFSKNKYSGVDGATEHQKNCVWKNYSDESVYPGLYAHFGYLPHRDARYLQHLRTVVNNGDLPVAKGMICLDGHMIFFERTARAVTFFDNDNKEAAFNVNANKRIKCIYYKNARAARP